MFDLELVTILRMLREGHTLPAFSRLRTLTDGEADTGVSGSRKMQLLIAHLVCQACADTLERQHIEVALRILEEAELPESDKIVWTIFVVSLAKDRGWRDVLKGMKRTESRSLNFDLATHLEGFSPQFDTSMSVYRKHLT